ncbi:MAG: hypothetical protein NPIRA01_07920 [Nitrospirales bacterium]|nr:MAG: hypothetical protein NPIRA01_07920 [Nitrospirales bacterium]
MRYGYKRNQQARFGSLFIACFLFFAIFQPFPSDQWIAHADDSSDDVTHFMLQNEVVTPLAIVSVSTSKLPKHTERSVTLFDLYVDEERPYITGDASKFIEESLEVLDSHRHAKLLVETYCDQRNATAYGMALSNQRTWQVREYVQYMEIPNSRILTTNYGKEDLQCPEKSTVCWEERVRVQSAFKYLAISQPKLGCLVRLGIMGVKKEFLPLSSTEQSQFLQKIKLAPVHQRRRLRRYVYRTPSNSLSHPSQKTTAHR